nr:hypothetical protein [Pseudomonadota bacterium]
MSFVGAALRNSKKQENSPAVSPALMPESIEHSYDQLQKILSDGIKNGQFRVDTTLVEGKLLALPEVQQKKILQEIVAGKSFAEFLEKESGSFAGMSLSELRGLYKEAAIYRAAFLANIIGHSEEILKGLSGRDSSQFGNHYDNIRLLAIVNSEYEQTIAVLKPLLKKDEEVKAKELLFEVEINARTSARVALENVAISHNKASSEQHLSKSLVEFVAESFGVVKNIAATMGDFLAFKIPEMLCYAAGGAYYFFIKGLPTFALSGKNPFEVVAEQGQDYVESIRKAFNKNPYGRGSLLGSDEEFLKPTTIVEDLINTNPFVQFGNGVTQPLTESLLAFYLAGTRGIYNVYNQTNYTQKEFVKLTDEVFGLWMGACIFDLATTLALSTLPLGGTMLSSSAKLRKYGIILGTNFAMSGLSSVGTEMLTENTQGEWKWDWARFSRNTLRQSAGSSVFMGLAAKVRTSFIKGGNVAAGEFSASLVDSTDGLGDVVQAAGQMSGEFLQVKNFDELTKLKTMRRLFGALIHVGTAASDVIDGKAVFVDAGKIKQDTIADSELDRPIYGENGDGKISTLRELLSSKGSDEEEGNAVFARLPRPTDNLDGVTFPVRNGNRIIDDLQLVGVGGLKDDSAKAAIGANGQLVWQSPNSIFNSAGGDGDGDGKGNEGRDDDQASFSPRNEKSGEFGGDVPTADVTNKRKERAKVAIIAALEQGKIELALSELYEVSDQTSQLELAQDKEIIQLVATLVVEELNDIMNDSKSESSTEVSFKSLQHLARTILFTKEFVQKTRVRESIKKTFDVLISNGDIEQANELFKFVIAEFERFGDTVQLPISRSYLLRKLIPRLFSRGTFDVSYYDAILKDIFIKFQISESHRSFVVEAIIGRCLFDGQFDKAERYYDYYEDDLEGMAIKGIARREIRKIFFNSRLSSREKREKVVDIFHELNFQDREKQFILKLVAARYLNGRRGSNENAYYVDPEHRMLMFVCSLAGVEGVGEFGFLRSVAGLALAKWNLDNVIDADSNIQRFFRHNGYYQISSDIVVEYAISTLLKHQQYQRLSQLLSKFRVNNDEYIAQLVSHFESALLRGDKLLEYALQPLDTAQQTYVLSHAISSIYCLEHSKSSVENIMPRTISELIDAIRDIPFDNREELILLSSKLAIDRLFEESTTEESLVKSQFARAVFVEVREVLKHDQKRYRQFLDLFVEQTQKIEYYDVLAMCLRKFIEAKLSDEIAESEMWKKELLAIESALGLTSADRSYIASQAIEYLMINCDFSTVEDYQRRYRAVLLEVDTYVEEESEHSAIGALDLIYSLLSNVTGVEYFEQRAVLLQKIAVIEEVLFGEEHKSYIEEKDRVENAYLKIDDLLLNQEYQLAVNELVSESSFEGELTFYPIGLRERGLRLLHHYFRIMNAGNLHHCMTNIRRILQASSDVNDYVTALRTDSAANQEIKDRAIGFAKEGNVAGVKSILEVLAEYNFSYVDKLAFEITRGALLNNRYNIISYLKESGYPTFEEDVNNVLMESLQERRYAIVRNHLGSSALRDVIDNEYIFATSINRILLQGNKTEKEKVAHVGSMVNIFQVPEGTLRRAMMK